MTPKSQNILKVIRNLKRVLPFARKESALNMGKMSAWLCGTAHCHAGWYAVATCNPLRTLIPIKMDFEDGIANMRKHLGFSGRGDLEEWAHDNPDIWGNTYGAYMFGYEEAFDSPKRPCGAKSLADIIDHWQEVHDRVKALEDAEAKKLEPKYEDITKELAYKPIQQEMPDMEVLEQLV